MSSCKGCHRSSQRKNPERRKSWYKEHYRINKPRLRIEQRFHRLKRVYGLARNQYMSMLESQKGVCAICKTPPGSRWLAVDHCHKSGKIRGLLCSRCNTALGSLREDPALFSAALAYLNKTALKNANPVQP